MSAADVVWHDVECSAYRADLGFWRELAAAERPPILDVGAGTGRVTLDLAAHGHEVVALDLDAELLAELDRRAAARGLRAQTVAADAAGFSLPGRSFGLIIAPMQTVQLLGAAERPRFLRSVREHLKPGGLAACAIADALEAFDGQDAYVPAPDTLVVDGVRYVSQPIALRDEGGRVAIERIRQTVDRRGRRSASTNVVHLDRVDPGVLENEAEAAGLTPLAPREIPATDEHIASRVVMLRG